MTATANKFGYWTNRAAGPPTINNATFANADDGGKIKQSSSSLWTEFNGFYSDWVTAPPVDTFAHLIQWAMLQRTFNERARVFAQAKEIRYGVPLIPPVVSTHPPYKITVIT